MRSLFIFALLTIIEVECRIVKTSYGSLRGKMVKSPRGPDGFSFLGIPITEPVDGLHRFKEAEPIQPWKGVKDALRYISCPQPPYKPLRDNNTIVKEDCLQTNVFTSKSCLEKGNCSVLAYVHGGARYFLSPEKTPEENIINNYANDERRIVFVALQFRLGVFAWLNLAPELKTTIDTNLGNRDLLFGLRWIQREIHNFGGDPNKVSFMGHSSGGQAVIEVRDWSEGYHSQMAMSPIADGLFNQALILSAPYWGERNNQSNTKWSRRIAEKAGCMPAGENFTLYTNVTRIEDCLREKSTDVLYGIQIDMDNEVELLEGVWIDGPGGMLPDSFKDLMKRELPRRRFFMGTVSHEEEEIKCLVDEAGSVNLTGLDELCTALGYEYNFKNPEGYRKVCNEEYSSAERVTDMNSDHGYYYPVVEFADKFALNGTVFVYSFEYPVKGERWSWNASVSTPRHAEDLNYFLIGNYSNFTEKDFEIERVYTGIIANFVNSGDPAYEEQEWKPYTKNNREYFVIDFDETMTMPGSRDGFRKRVAEFYERVERAAGYIRPLKDLPPKMDWFTPSTLVNSYTSEWTNDTMFYIQKKNYKAAMNLNRLWKKHVAHLQKIKVHEKTGFDWLNFVLAVIVTGLVVAIMYVLYSHWKKRREYQSL